MATLPEDIGYSRAIDLGDKADRPGQAMGRDCPGTVDLSGTHMDPSGLILLAFVVEAGLDHGKARLQITHNDVVYHQCCYDIVRHGPARTA